jgi:hypothetical protein
MLAECSSAPGHQSWLALVNDRFMVRLQADHGDDHQ